MYSAIIVAAGTGSRSQLNYSKIEYKINGQMIIEHTAKIFLEDPDFNEIIIVVNKLDLKVQQAIQNNKIKFVNGGNTRQESVIKGLQKVTNLIVFIHDGARPFLSKLSVTKLKEVDLVQNQAATLALPITDSIRYVDQEKILSTIDRVNLFTIQTPQVAHTKDLIKAHAWATANNFTATDETELLLQIGIKAKVIIGTKENIKLTNPEDFK